MMRSNAKVVPIETIAVSASRSRNTYADFRTTFIAAMLIGLHVPYSLWATKIRALDSPLQAWNTLLIFARTVLLFVYWWFSKLFWPTVSTQISFDTQNLAGYAIIWIFILKGQSIKKSLKKMFALLSKLGARETNIQYHTRTKLFLCATVLGFLIWTAVKFFYFGAWYAVASRLKSYVPGQSDSLLHYCLTWIVIFSFIFSYYMGTAVLYVSLIICAHTYRCSGLLLRLYGEKLQEITRAKSLTSSMVSRSLELFRRSSSCIKDVDEAFSLCACFIYAAVMNDMFTVLSVVFSKDRKFGSLEYTVFMTLKALSAFCMFFYITYSGESVAREKILLERKVVQVSTCVMKPQTTTALAEAFYSLQSSIKYTDISVTVYDFFDINRKLILSAAGVFVTYGVYMYNFAASEHA